MGWTTSPSVFKLVYQDKVSLQSISWEMFCFNLEVMSSTLFIIGLNQMLKLSWILGVYIFNILFFKPYIDISINTHTCVCIILCGRYAILTQQPIVWKHLVYTPEQELVGAQREGISVRKE
jgi:hypothetical protein